MTATTTRNHKHKEASSRTVGWTYCVNPRNCDGVSHGGVTHVEQCACGATRRVESNGNRTVAGPWLVD